MPDSHAYLQDDLWRRGRRRWPKELGTRLLHSGKSYAVILGLLIAVALEIPWLQEPLKKIGFENPTGITLSVIIFILVLIFFDVRSIAAAAAEGPTEGRHLAGPLDVYPVLFERIKRIKHREDKVLDIIGMTLYTAYRNDAVYGVA